MTVAQVNKALTKAGFIKRTTKRVDFQNVTTGNFEAFQSGNKIGVYPFDNTNELLVVLAPMGGELIYTGCIVFTN